MKNKILLIFAVVFLVLTLQNVLSLGVTPGRTTINFESGLSQEISFSVVNTEHKEMEVVVTTRGDLASYIKLNKLYDSFNSEDESKSFTYQINLPTSFDKPGKYEGEIVVLEMPKGFRESGTSIGATVAVISQVQVYVAYPDKYLDAEVNVIDASGKTMFFIPVINRGKLDVVNAQAIVDIYSPSNEKIVSLESTSDSVLSLERKELVAQWETNVNPGKYKAIVTVRYDNEVTSVEKDFNVGEMFLEILEVVVNDFSLGEIAKFNALVENKWSSDLEEVYLNILVYNNEGETMADFKSPTYDINSLAKSEMVAYWDTGGVHEGTYDGKLILKYGERSTEKNIQMKISSDSLEVIGITGHVLVKTGGGFNLNNLLVIVVIILVLANIFWFVVIKRILKKRKK